MNQEFFRFFVKEKGMIKTIEETDSEKIFVYLSASRFKNKHGVECYLIRLATRTSNLCMERTDPDRLDLWDENFHIFERVIDKEGKTLLLAEIDEESLALAFEKLFEKFSEIGECKHCSRVFKHEKLFANSCSTCHININILKSETFECFVCKENYSLKNKKDKYCINDHTDMMCKRCYNKITKCPLCREDLYVDDSDIEEE